MTTRLRRLYTAHGQSPWLDNLERSWLGDGTLDAYLERGIRGITSNPTIFEKAISGTDDYDEQFHDLVTSGASIEDVYWTLVTTDIRAALDRLRPLHADSAGRDGFVSLELAPDLAHDADASVAAAAALHDEIAAPNLLVKVPGTAEGVHAVRRTVAAGHSVNVTLIFSLDRYGDVIDAYLDGLEACEGDLSSVASVASFFVSRVDTEVDRRLEAIGTDDALALRGRAAVANAKLAYALFEQRFSGDRWDALAARGARVQRPLWASTSTKNPDYPDTLYVDPLIGPDTVNTMPHATIDAFDGHGTLAETVSEGADEARAVFDDLGEIGVDVANVTDVLESEGVNAFQKSHDSLLATLTEKSA